MHIRQQILLGIILAGVSFLFDSGEVHAQRRRMREVKPIEGVKVGAFDAEEREFFNKETGLPDEDVRGVAIAGDGSVYAATTAGLARWNGESWESVPGLKGPALQVATHGEGVIAIAGGGVFEVTGTKANRLADAPPEAVAEGAAPALVGGASIGIGTPDGLFRLRDGKFVRDDVLQKLLGDEADVRQIVRATDGRIALAAQAGLFLGGEDSPWVQLFPRAGNRSWAPHDVRGVAFDRQDRLWFASPQGVGVLDGEAWTLYTGEDGLPYNDFTTAAAGEEGVVWFGTKIGAIRFDGEHWSYRQGLRWVPDDLIRGIAVNKQGDAWFATSTGAGVIQRRPVTLAEKAKYFEEEIDKYNRRTPYGFVDRAGLDVAGDKSTSRNLDSDNDGLWTSMYGAGECFAYAATKDPQAKQRAKDTFEALRFLTVVTRDSSHPPPAGFVARTILPTSGEDPNAEHYTPEKDRRKQREDPYWKIISPRWPTSADGKWYWKCDTSSDELDGHYFFNACYYDLVAETDLEKARVRDIVLPMTDHLIDNGFRMIDHDGKPTRWAFFDPQTLNHEQTMGRGLNSLSILSYLKVAEHISGGDEKYRKAYNDLIEKHGYATNVEFPKWQNGPGSGNQSDDEMAFMCYYTLLKYETDETLRRKYLRSLWDYWRLEEPENNPLFNFIFAARFDVPERWRRFWSPPQSVITDSITTLKQIPLDRIDWSYKNSHRIDIVPLGKHILRSRGTGHLRNGKCLPIDERRVEHWNHNPFELDGGSGGRILADGAVYLLPYYMGLYHGYILEDAE
ncbi:Two component regulator propeller [Symmachiella dynata]|uniref:hypothetical protein n=1 Tax=Symmachiella dynata TaxID=2527995 RepID=UPI0011899649|nr:hypothetical protein [Symmachiella dynata]QDT48063.1 Two component regulator propeller [Symmachiella dynata]